MVQTCPVSYREQSLRSNLPPILIAFILKKICLCHVYLFYPEMRRRGNGEGWWAGRREGMAVNKFIPSHNALGYELNKVTCDNAQFSSVQSLSCVQLFVTPWTAAHQASLSITNCQSPPKPMSIVLVMPSNHLILCCPVLLETFNSILSLLEQNSEDLVLQGSIWTDLSCLIIYPSRYCSFYSRHTGLLPIPWTYL